MIIQHDTLLKLVAQVNGALALISWPFVLYEVFTKHPGIADLKERIDQRRNELLGSVVFDLSDCLKQYLPQRTSIIVVEPDYGEEHSEGLSEAAIGEMKTSLESNEKSLHAAIKLRGIAPRVLALDRCGYWLIFCTAVESLGALITWVFVEKMSDRLAMFLLGFPIVTAVFALTVAGVRQGLIHSAQRLLVGNERFNGSRNQRK